MSPPSVAQSHVQTNTDSYSFLQKLLLIAGITLVVLLLVAVFVTGLQIFAYGFVSVLIALAFRSVATVIERRTPIKGKLAYGLSLLLFIAVLALVIVITGPQLVEEVQRMTETIPQAVDQLRDSLDDVQIGQDIFNALDNVQMSEIRDSFGSDFLSQLTGIVSSTLGFLVAVFVVIVVAIYMGFEPHLYVDTMVRLVPPKHRDRAWDVLRAINDVLVNWLVARTASVIIVGILTYIGLTVLGMPLALTLAIIAALLSYIPNIGPTLSAIPAVLIGFSQSPEMALYMVVLYAGVQTVESYFITPFIQQETISLPPVGILLAQVLFTIILGRVGLPIAAPFVAVLMVLVKKLYIEDILGEPTQKLTGNESS